MLYVALSLQGVYVQQAISILPEQHCKLNFYKNYRRFKMDNNNNTNDVVQLSKYCFLCYSILDTNKICTNPECEMCIQQIPQ